MNNCEPSVNIVSLGAEPSNGDNLYRVDVSCVTHPENDAQSIGIVAESEIDEFLSQGFVAVLMGVIPQPVFNAVESALLKAAGRLN